jgi:hypothetical protein
MNSELERMWKEVLFAQIEVVCQLLPEGTK